MKIIKPSYEIMEHGNNPLQHIEKIGRICYKSENKITSDSASKFCLKLFENRHMAMLEHFIFVLEVNQDVYCAIKDINEGFIRMSETEFTDVGITRYLVSGSARAWSELYAEYEEIFLRDIVAAIVQYYHCEELFGLAKGEMDNVMVDDTIIIYDKDDILELLTDDELAVHDWMSVKFVVDRGVSHELVRHRIASFAQESTRYCNYSGECTFIEPPLPNKISQIHWEVAMQQCEEAYKRLTSLGVSPQIARDVLTTSVKTEIVVTATLNEWKHIFKLRAVGTTGAPHPQMKEVMLPLLMEIQDDTNYHYIFNTIV